MTLTRRIVLDVVVRGRLGFVFGGAALLVSTLAYGLESPTPGTAVALSALLSAYVAVGLPFYLLNQREVTQLPAKRRDLWRARLIVAAAFPLAIGLPVRIAGLSLGAANGGWPSAPDALLSALTDGLFCLSLLGVAAVWPVRLAPYDPKHRRLSLTGVAVFAAVTASPLIFRSILPVTSNRLGTGAGLLVGFWAVLAAIAIAHQPRNEPRAERAVFRFRKPARAPRFRLPGDALTGLPGLWSVHMKEVVLVTPFAFGMIAIIETMTEGRPWHSTREFLHLLQLMPFDIDSPFDGRRDLNLMVFVFIGVGNKARELMLRARALRILPMTSTGLASTFAGLAVTTAGILWIILIGIHIAAVGHLPVTLRVDLFAVFAGGLVVFQAFESVFPSPFVGRLVAMLVFIPCAVAVTGAGRSDSLALPVAGGLAIVAGVFLHAWLFRRRQKLYKFKPPTLFGRSMPS